MQRVLIAGASGALGRQVTSQATRAGLYCRVFGRDDKRLRALGAHEWATGNATTGEGLELALRDIDCVFSCLGASVQPDFKAGRQSYAQVDFAANQNLLRAAVAAGVKRMVYVSVAEHERLAGLEYVKAHEQVVTLLRNSGLSYAVVRPTGFFSAFEAVLELARRGRVPLLGNPNARTNPIADADLARVCVEQILTSENSERSVGGPEVLTRRDIALLAFEVLGQPPKLSRVPTFPAKALLPFVGLVNPRVADITRFFLAVSSIDCIAPASGTKKLRQHFSTAVGKY
jgi:uncharacterized protein YbjT (DUF2867 family)